ncbi:Pentatricopeptide repeat-containing protein [Platanthera guangdongensis]|uniref:Pentatricopeptide repeat-containing protein n=1 Tax=Platanthera guangdongensis TaxID=2320717 RepID=A0ABR2LNC0_9ASPA
MLRKRPAPRLPFRSQPSHLSAVDASPASFPLKHLLAHAIVSGLWRDPSSPPGSSPPAPPPTPLRPARLRRISRRSAFSYTTMIRAHSSGPAPSNSILIFSGMLRSGFYRPTASPSPSSSAPPLALFPPFLLTRPRPPPRPRRDPHVATSLLHAYASRGLIDSASRCSTRNASQNRSHLERHYLLLRKVEKQAAKRLSLFNQMISTGARPNVDTLIASISCCADGVGLIPNGKALHALSIRLLPSSSIDELGTSLITMYARTGSLKNALKVFDEIEAKDSSTLTAMIGGLAMHGRGEEAVAIFQKMVVGEDAIRPDSVAFTAVLHACSQRRARGHGGEDFRRFEDGALHRGEDGALWCHG